MHTIPAPPPSAAPSAFAAPQKEPQDPSAAAPSAVPRATGPLHSGNPRGNPNVAPRCGVKARTTGLGCRAPAIALARMVKRVMEGQARAEQRAGQEGVDAGPPAFAGAGSAGMTVGEPGVCGVGVASDAARPVVARCGDGAGPAEPVGLGPLRGPSPPTLVRFAAQAREGRGSGSETPCQKSMHLYSG